MIWIILVGIAVAIVCYEAKHAPEVWLCHRCQHEVESVELYCPVCNERKED